MNYLQYEGSNPNHSVWVLASAGTGKTKILTDRVLRLLLNGVEFNKILCLTFTNAAAQEMILRIHSKLVNWANLDEQALRHELETLLLRKANNEEIQRAKFLYQVALNLPDKMHISTIHSYCQKILKRFPFEASITPSFQILDEVNLPSIIYELRNSLLVSDENKELMDFFSANFHELIIEEILENIINHKIKFKNYFAGNEINYNEKIINIDKQKNLALIDITYDAQKLCDLVSSNDELRHDTRLQQLYLALKLEKNYLEHEVIYSFFLIKTGEKRSKILQKKITDNYPNLLLLLEQIQEQIYNIDQLEKTKQTYIYSDLLLKLAKNFLHIYEEYKIKHNLLDYDDLIYNTYKLLSNSEVRDWVLYKLDGGIDHILTDESQDTSHYQWQIIQNLIEEFYSGQGIDTNRMGTDNRTIFVVGDEKQSIFSFQGADLEVFHMMNHYFKTKLQGAEKKFKIINLEHSYRSTPAILDSVYNIFDRIKYNFPNSFIANNSKVIPFRKNDYGKVELWPLVSSIKEDDFFWYKDAQGQDNLEPYKMLAIKIALYIQSQINNKVILSSTGMPARAGDFLILIRKRDELSYEIINQLKIHNLDVAGIDRMMISDNLSVMDLIAIAKFVLTPFDNLNLASLLKSPIIGLSNSEIEVLMYDKPQNISLWQYIQEQLKSEGSSYLQLLKFFVNLSKTNNSSDFFHQIVDQFGYRKILIKINGEEDNQAISEFIYLASDYCDNVSTSLQEFIYWFEDNPIDIKRSYVKSDKIKIMTVHSAKGLEAPVVILCDTTSMPVNKDKFIWTKDNKIIATLTSTSAPKIFHETKEIRKQKEFEEYLRLFYVALTRACDHLIICGYSNSNTVPDLCWYNLAKNSMQEFARIGQDGNLIYQGDIAVDHTEDNPEPNLTKIEDSAQTQHIQYQVNIKKLLSILPSIVSNNNEQIHINSLLNSPLTKYDNIKYGKIFHKILEDTIKIKKIHEMHLHPLINTLPPSLQERALKTLNLITQNQELIALLNFDTKTEVNIGAKLEDQYKIARIDLLVIEKDKVTIIDYKSDFNPPNNYNFIPQNYIQQLINYKQIIETIYKGYNIECKILWLQTGEFTNILN